VVVGEGIVIWFVCSAPLMILGACLYVVRNSSGVTMVLVSLF
jgi:hypothetical protein